MGGGARLGMKGGQGANFAFLPLLRFVGLVLLLGGAGLAHPMPNSVVLLDIHAQDVDAELQLPLSELGLALKEDVRGDPQALLTRRGEAWRAYLARHVGAAAPDGKAWRVTVRDLSVKPAEQTLSGPYQELVAHLTLTPPPGARPRDFTLKYSAILHQVVTHRALVAVRADWAGGVAPRGEPSEIGVIAVNPVDGRLLPLRVHLSAGGLWTGFRGMFSLGAAHIQEGTDHLLFLLTLLLPAPLVAGSGRWGGFAGGRRSLLNILRIVTAFTAGHSLTLILATVGHLNLPARPIEALIALSILISALHALRPLFPGREVLIAGGFGLIHGLAFSFTLVAMKLSPAQLALSLLGFNLGIEARQLVVIALTLPWLILLARTPAYRAVRVGGAAAALLAALGWLGQRLGVENPLAQVADSLGPSGPWLVLGLALTALTVTVVQRRKSRLEQPSP